MAYSEVPFKRNSLLNIIHLDFRKTISISVYFSTIIIYFFTFKSIKFVLVKVPIPWYSNSWLHKAAFGKWWSTRQRLMMVGLEAALTNWSQLLSATHYCFLQLQLYQFHNNQKKHERGKLLFHFIHQSWTIICSSGVEDVNELRMQFILASCRQRNIQIYLRQSS